MLRQATFVLGCSNGLIHWLWRNWDRGCQRVQWSSIWQWLKPWGYQMTHLLWSYLVGNHLFGVSIILSHTHLFFNAYAAWRSRRDSGNHLVTAHVSVYCSSKGLRKSQGNECAPIESVNEPHRWGFQLSSSVLNFLSGWVVINTEMRKKTEIEWLLMLYDYIVISLIEHLLIKHYRSHVQIQLAGHTALDLMFRH